MSGTKYDVTEFHDNIAQDYDKYLDSSISANYIREEFRKRILKSIKPGMHLLEIGCGTGTDAVFLAKNGIKVTAADISPNMIMAAETKIKENGLSHLIETAILDAENLGSLNGRTFDGLISNLDAVNYVKDINLFSENAAKILIPGAKVFFVMLNKICLWEVMYNLLKFKPVTAINRLLAREKDYKTEMRLYFPRKIKKIFIKKFITNRITGFGFLEPPDGLSFIYKRHKVFFGKLHGLEYFLCSKYPFYNFCDHYLIEMTKKR